MRFVLVAALVVSTVSFAQTSTGTQTRKVPTSEIRFDNEGFIEGTPTAPDGTLIDGNRGPKFYSLIRVRKDFNDKLKASVNDLR